MTLWQLLAAKGPNVTVAADQISGWQILILVGLTVLLVFAVVKKLAKTALLLALIVGVGALVVYGNSAGWFDQFNGA
ncbi:MAG: hypothetical protein KDC39_07665 [Actinobacteria bacterium]|nr:hypothetical protein [Actinomycetota bacterium]